jgi:hypothetical protein
VRIISKLIWNEQGVKVCGGFICVTKWGPCDEFL